MTNNEIYYFLGKCLSLGESDVNKQDIVTMISQNKVDWDGFVKLASNQYVLPTVYLRFKRHGILSLIPEELSDHLQMVYELNYKRNSAVLEQIDRINSLLAQAGIIPIYLKGAANLLDHLYEDIGERMLGDIDLLVSEEEFLPAANLLKREGYEHYLGFYDDEPLPKHFPRLVHPIERLDVEVHRAPVELNIAPYLNYDSILPEAKQIGTVPPCFVFSDRHKVILNFMHAFLAKDAKLMHNVTFRNMVDLQLLSQRVDIYTVLAAQTHYAQEAMIYACYMNKAMGLRNNRTPGFRLRHFVWRQELLRKSKLLYQLIWLWNFLKTKVLTNYLQQIVGAFFDKKIRKSIFRRLRDPSWFRQHIKFYTKNFNEHLFNKGKSFIA